MNVCPLCGDWSDTKDWCNHCNLPMKEVVREPEYDDPGEKAYEEYCWTEYSKYCFRELKKVCGNIMFYIRELD